MVRGLPARWGTSHRLWLGARHAQQRLGRADRDRVPLDFRNYDFLTEDRTRTEDRHRDVFAVPRTARKPHHSTFDQINEIRRVARLKENVPLRAAFERVAHQSASRLGVHLYGMGLAVAFRALERRHLAHLFIDARLRNLWLRRRRPAGTPTPALLLFFIAAGTLLPIILS